ADNDAGARLARELRTLTFGVDWPVKRFFSARQVRRLPYLFSVAPEGFSIPGLPPDRQPPARAGFPPTHELLEESYRRILLALEGIVVGTPYLFGARPTLADFSIYGQIRMNFADPSANAFIAATAPTVHRWIQGMDEIDPRGLSTAEAVASDALRPLLAEICRLYVPLMQQNAAALERFRRAGETRFNEAAFDAGRCLYDGEIDGRPFRSVAKSFQAKTWRRLCEAWSGLADRERRRVESLLPSGIGLRIC
ncbi:MAG: glutathione S-transferase C-terminal domain-containing protein, partial [Candidatus Binatia bacterium]